MVRALATGAEGSGFKTNFKKLFPFTKRGTDVPTCQGLEEEERRPTSVTPLPVQVGSLTATSLQGHWLKDNVYLCISVGVEPLPDSKFSTKPPLPRPNQGDIRCTRVLVTEIFGKISVANTRSR